MSPLSKSRKADFSVTDCALAVAAQQCSGQVLQQDLILLGRQVWLGASPGLQEMLLQGPWRVVAVQRAQLLNWLRPAKQQSSAPRLLPCTRLLSNDLLPLVTIQRSIHRDWRKSTVAYCQQAVQAHGYFHHAVRRLCAPGMAERMQQDQREQTKQASAMKRIAYVGQVEITSA